MPKKSLQNWYNNNDINYNQKEIIKKFGVGDYYPEHELKDFRKIYYWNDILERKIHTFYGGNIGEPIYQINFFSTWWNNNLILFIDGEDNNREDYFWIKLIVYEMPHRQMKEIFEVFTIELSNSNNCENFVNRCVVGLDFSELGEKKAEEKIQDYKRKKELNIEKQLNITKSNLDALVSYTPQSTINEIKEYRRNSGYENFSVMRDGVNMYDACIEVQPPKYIFREIYNRR